MSKLEEEKKAAISVNSKQKKRQRGIRIHTEDSSDSDFDSETIQKVSGEIKAGSISKIANGIVLEMDSLSAQVQELF